MSLYNKVDPTTDKKLSTAGKVTALNPNAVEFVPLALRSYPGSTSAANASSIFATVGNASFKKAELQRSESSVSNKSDEEAHQYWQLPDDITPDFKVMGEDDTPQVNSLQFSNLSLTNANEVPRFNPSAGSSLLLKEHQELSPYAIGGGGFAEKMVTSYGEDPSFAGYHNMHTEPWDRQSMSNDQILNSVITEGGAPYNGNSGQGFLNDLLNEQQMLETTDVNPLEFLASQFPGFAAESLTDVYFANGGDLNLTIEMLTQLELQVDGGLNQNLNSKALSVPNLSALDFPALSVSDSHNGMPKFSGDEFQQNVGPYRAPDKENLLLFKSSSSIAPRGAIDFASAVRKMPPAQDSGMWKYDRNGSAGASVGTSRSSHVLASSYNGGKGRGIYGDRVQGRSSPRAAPVWLETGEAVANMYSETREEARDHARVRNAYFEQARHAYLIGNKALAKELSVKGQLHNMQMKAAHAKAQESIYRQRNPRSAEMLGNGRGQERLIDLHGLHANEAIHVLKRDLTMLRSSARSAGQRLQVYICVGTGHHTRGSRTPARLPTAVQRYLLEEEGLDFSEPQAGLLRVVIY